MYTGHLSYLFFVFMLDTSLNVAHAKLCNYEDLGAMKNKLFEVNMKVLYSCLLYLEIYSVILRPCNTGWKQLLVNQGFCTCSTQDYVHVILY